MHIRIILYTALIIFQLSGGTGSAMPTTNDFKNSPPQSEIKQPDKNVFGQPLESCCNKTETGFYRNGFCKTGHDDLGVHVACAIVNEEFLNFTRTRGNDLMTPRPEYSFPGLKAGDKWCLCASRWVEALEAGVAPPLVLNATHHKMLEYTDIETLKRYAYEQQTYPVSKSGAYQFVFQGIDGHPIPLVQFSGQVILVVNTASQCGFTGQYKGLQEIFERYRDEGLTVIGVPCNQFGRQEPGSEKDISEFIRTEYGITFPVTTKTDVSGPEAHPFFTWASAQKKGGFLQSSPKWNFHKFLVGRDGQLAGSFGSHISPESQDLITAIEKELSEK